MVSSFSQKITKICLACITLCGFGLTAPLSAQSVQHNDHSGYNTNGNSQNGSAQSYQQQIPQPQTPQSLVRWYTDFNQALTTAQQQQKPILLFFSGSDWCGWCMRLEKEVFNTPEFASSVGNDFIFVELDFPMNKAIPQNLLQQNNSLKEKFNVSGYPTVVILDQNQNILATTGYRPGGPAQYATYLKGLIGK